MVIPNLWLSQEKNFTDVECKHCFNVHWRNPKYTAVVISLLKKCNACKQSRFYNKTWYHSLVSTFATTGDSLFWGFLKQNKPFLWSRRKPQYFTLSLILSCTWNMYIIEIIHRASRRCWCSVWKFVFFFSLHKNHLQALWTAYVMKKKKKTTKI